MYKQAPVVWRHNLATYARSGFSMSTSAFTKAWNQKSKSSSNDWWSPDVFFCAYYALFMDAYSWVVCRRDRVRGVHKPPGGPVGSPWLREVICLKLHPASSGIVLPCRPRRWFECHGDVAHHQPWSVFLAYRPTVLSIAQPRYTSSQ